jgi:hypothetical protein
MSSESQWLGFQHTSDVLGGKRLRVRKLNAGGFATTRWYITLVNYQSLTQCYEVLSSGQVPYRPSCSFYEVLYSGQFNEVLSSWKLYEVQYSNSW